MPLYYVLETEKAYNLQQGNVFTIVFLDKRNQPNKIQVMKMMQGEGKNPLKITSLLPYKKIKKRGKSGHTVKQFRPKKYFIKLPVGETLSNPKQEETLS
jgi:hypothetical protein